MKSKHMTNYAIGMQNKLQNKTIYKPGPSLLQDLHTILLLTTPLKQRASGEKVIQ